MMDVTTGENKRGTRINKLRKELLQDRLASLFETPDELAWKVTSALHHWEIQSSRERTTVRAGAGGRSETCRDGR